MVAGVSAYLTKEQLDDLGNIVKKILNRESSFNTLGESNNRGMTLNQSSKICQI